MTAIAARVAVPQEHVHIARWSAAMGGLAWFLALPLLHAWGRLGWAEAMLLLAALVIVPLGFGLIEVPVRGGRPPRVWHWAVRWQLATALLLVASLGCSVPWAVVLSVPYVLVTCLAALAGAGRFLGRLSLREREAFRGELVIFRGPTLRVGHLSAPDSESQATPRGARGDTPGLHPLCIDAALVYLPGGAIGHVLSLLDTPLLGFEPVIVRLTAVHLHYVGFALPLLAGLTVGQVRRSSPRPSDISSGLCVAVVLGFPLVAAAMALAQHTTWRAPELVAVVLLSATCCLLAWWQVRATLTLRQPAAAMLLGFSGISLATAMGLAVVYAVGVYLGTHWLDIPAMLPTHGVLQAMGFALCGLLAWHAAGSSGERPIS